MSNLLETLQNLEGVVCLVGSTTYYEDYLEANRLLTLMGNVVLSVGQFGNSIHSEVATATPDERIKLLHFQKVEMADYVVWIRPDYCGASTKAELLWAKSLNKPLCGFTLGERGDLTRFITLTGYKHFCDPVKGLSHFLDHARFKRFQMSQESLGF